jgi:hypothetical protein
VPRRSNRFEQLHLDLQWQYLNWLSETSEQDEFYEKTSLTLLKDRKRVVQISPLWPEMKNLNQ